MSIDEPSKAVQEVAKATREALPLARDFGEFVARIIGGPLREASGIIEDKLAFVRYERAMRFRKKAEQLMIELGMEGPTTPVPLNVSIPLLQEATLQENDELQDMWVRLLVNAVQSDSKVEVTRSFVSILSDFGPLEAKLLERIVNAPDYAKQVGRLVMTGTLPDQYFDFTVANDKRSTDSPPSEASAVALWNLVRLGCISPVGSWGGAGRINMVAETELGRSLVLACTLPAPIELID